MGGCLRSGGGHVFAHLLPAHVRAPRDQPDAERIFFRRSSPRAPGHTQGASRVPLQGRIRVSYPSGWRQQDGCAIGQRDRCLANEEGSALELQGYNWQEWDSATIAQSEQERVENQLSSFLLTKTKSELLQEAAKRRILLAPVSTTSDVSANPQLAFRQFWQHG